MALTSKTPKDTYKDLLEIDNSNSGADSTVRSIKTGDGSSTAIGTSDRSCVITSTTDNTGAFYVQNAAEAVKFKVDTTNNQVKALDIHVNTQYHTFGLTGSASSSVSAGQHLLLHSDGIVDNELTLSPLHMGTGTDPATSLTLSNNALSYIKLFWYLPDSISIDSVTSIEAADAATGDTTRFHLMGYDYTDGSASVLTNGTLLAHSADQVNAGYEQMYVNTWTIDSAAVLSGKAILVFWEQDGTNGDYSVSVTVKYHLS